MPEKLLYTDNVAENVKTETMDRVLQSCDNNDFHYYLQSPQNILR